MESEQKANFLKMLGVIYDAYRVDLSKGVAEFWWNCLLPYDIEAIRSALSRYAVLPEGQFLPKPADVVRMLSGSTQDVALLAWTKVDKAVRKVGPWESVVFDDPLIMRVLSDMGGWTFLGSKGDDDWPFVAKEFEARYRGYASRGELPPYPRVLVGNFEAGNVSAGQPTAPPVLLGDRERALYVHRNGAETIALPTTPLRVEDLKPALPSPQTP